MSALAFLFLHVGVVFAQGTSLGSVAGSMQPGTWVELTTNNIDATLTNTGGATGMSLPYADSAVWDPITRRLLFMGGDHAPNPCYPRFVSYTDSTNAWQLLPQPSWFPCTPTSAMHGYNHTALDTVNRKLYHRPFNDMVVRKYDLSSQTWSALPAIPSSVMGYNNCCVGVEWFPERQSLIYVSRDAETSGAVVEYHEPSGQWRRIAGSLPIGPYHHVARYNPVHKVVIFGGGNSDRHLYKLDSAGQVTAMRDAPFALAIHSSIITVDPVSGKYLIFNNAKEFYVYDVISDTWQRQSLSVPIFNTPLYDPVVMGTVASPVSTYGINMFVKCYVGDCQVYLYKHSSGTGAPPADVTAPSVSISSPAAGATVSGTITITATATDDTGVAGVQFKVDGNNIGQEDTTSPYSVSWSTASVGNGSHTITALARDTSGNETTAGPVSVSVSNSSSSPGGSTTFQTLCGRPGVLKCVGFDDASDLEGGYGSNSGILVGDSTPQIDLSIKSSGNGSLKFTIPSTSGADTSGSYFTNFSADLSAQFGANSEFYVQWRQRFSPEFINTAYSGGGGWKQAIIGTGDKGGCSPSNLSDCYASCTALTVVTQNIYHRGFPQMYNSCTGSASHGAYDAFEEPFGSSDFELQNARSSPYCLYTQGQSNPTRFFPPAGNCFGYFPNEWMTFQIQVKPGPRVGDEFTNSYVRLWMAREGQAGELVMDWGPYNLTAANAATDQKFGKIWLLPYNTGKSSSVSYPTAYTWYDDLIISTQPIDMSVGSGGTTPSDTTAPSITMTSPANGSFLSGNVTVSAAASDNVGVIGVQFLLDGASLGAEDVTSPYSMTWSTTTASNGSHALSARARDAAGNRTTSSVTTITLNNAPPDATTGLSGLWRFEEGTGSTTADSSGNSNAGSLINGPAWVAGKVGNGLQFNATDNGNDNDDPRVTLGRTFDIPGIPFTLLAWVKPTDFADYRAIISKRDSYSAADMRADLGLMQGSGKVSLGRAGSVVNFDHAVQPNIWTHLAVVATATDTKLYVDGILRETKGVFSLGSDSAANTVIGGTGEGTGGDNDPFKGLIDEVRTYNRALSESDVQDVYSATAPVTPPLPTTQQPTTTFTIPSNGGASWTTVGTSTSDRNGYMRIVPDAGGPPPSGIAIFGLRVNGVLVSEAGVPASSLIQTGRIYVDINGPANTGIAIANPSSQDALVTFYFTGAAGTDFGQGSFTLGANRQIAKFLNQAPFNASGSIHGTFTFSSTVPISVVAIRGFTNERSEFLMTTLPVAPVGQQTGNSVVLPHFARGGGWTTQVILTNPSNVVLSGNVQFVGSDGVVSSTSTYSIPPRSLHRLISGTAQEPLQVGSVRINGSTGAVPTATAIFSFQNHGTVVSEASVSALPTGTAFRIYAESSGAMLQSGSIHTGLAIANTSSNAVLVNLELLGMDGTSAVQGSISIPGNGQVARFIRDLFSAVPADFQGFMRVTAATPIGVTALRGRYNERGDFLITTTPPLIEGTEANVSEVVFPHVADGGGYSTQFVLFGQPSSGRLWFISHDGVVLPEQNLQRVE